MTKSVDYTYARPKLELINILEKRYAKYQTRINKFIRANNHSNYPERWDITMDQIGDELYATIADYEDHGFIYKEGDAKYGYVRPKQLP